MARAWNRWTRPMTVLLAWGSSTYFKLETISLLCIQSRSERTRDCPERRQTRINQLRVDSRWVIGLPTPPKGQVQVGRGLTFKDVRSVHGSGYLGKFQEMFPVSSDRVIS